MSSEAITQNDLRGILSRTVGSIPSEYKKLLWTNPSPTASFSAQTISLDLSNYDDIEVVAKHWTNNDTVVSSRCGALELGCVLVPNGSNSHMAYRDWQGYTDHIYIASGRDINGTSISSTDASAIPLHIYGIKYERVAPPQMEVPMVAYNENFVGSSGTINKTHTIADNGLYLILARANAYNGSAVPAVRLFVNNVRFTQNADAGGSTMTYLIATLSAGDVIKAEFSATNAGAEGDWNNLAIIRLGSTS